MKDFAVVLFLMALVVFVLLVVALAVSDVVALFDALDDAVLMSVAAGGRE